MLCCGDDNDSPRCWQQRDSSGPLATADEISCRTAAEVRRLQALGIARGRQPVPVAQLEASQLQGGPPLATGSSSTSATGRDGGGGIPRPGAQGPAAAEVAAFDGPHERVVVNVYHLIDEGANRKLDAVGIGLFHTGVQVYGLEWSYGEAVEPTQLCGLFYLPPRTAAGQLKASLDVGTTLLSPEQVDTLLHRLENEWLSRDYHVCHNNCNHFAAYFLRLLSAGQPAPMTLPNWCNRLANAADTLVPRRLATWFVHRIDGSPPVALHDPPRGNIGTLPRSVVPRRWYRGVARPSKFTMLTTPPGTHGGREPPPSTAPPQRLPAHADPMGEMLRHGQPPHFVLSPKPSSRWSNGNTPRPRLAPAGPGLGSGGSVEALSAEDVTSLTDANGSAAEAMERAATLGSGEEAAASHGAVPAALACPESLGPAIGEVPPGSESLLPAVDPPPSRGEDEVWTAHSCSISHSVSARRPSDVFPPLDTEQDPVQLSSVNLGELALLANSLLLLRPDDGSHVAALDHRPATAPVGDAAPDRAPPNPIDRMVRAAPAALSPVAAQRRSLFAEDDAFSDRGDSPLGLDTLDEDEPTAIPCSRSPSSRRHSTPTPRTPFATTSGAAPCAQSLLSIRSSSLSESPAAFFGSGSRGGSGESPAFDQPARAADSAERDVDGSASLQPSTERHTSPLVATGQRQPLGQSINLNVSLRPEGPVIDKSPQRAVAELITEFEAGSD